MKKTNSKLPVGVSAVKNRDGLYQFQVMIYGRRHSEYYKISDTALKQNARNSELQKEIDKFREKCELGISKNAINEKTPFPIAFEYFIETKRAFNKLRGSTINECKKTFENYVLPYFGNKPIGKIVSTEITALYSELLTNGGYKIRYTARPALVEKIKNSPLSLTKTAKELGIMIGTLIYIRDKTRLQIKDTAQKVADYFNLPLDVAFEKITTREPLKGATICRLNADLSGFFTLLVKQGVLTVNPCTAAEKPAKGEPSAVFLEPFQVPIFLNALNQVKDISIRMCLLLCLRLGLRSGEARGLYWSDIDFENNIVHIRQAVNNSENGNVIGETKTKNSVRDIPIDNDLRRVIFDYKQELTARIDTLGTAFNNKLNLVCPTATGGIINSSNLRYAIDKIVENNPQLPKGLHPHSLRHTFCSLLIANGIDIASVAELSGDTISTISKTYIHAIQDRKTHAMHSIKNIFEETCEPTIIHKIA